MAKLIGLPLFLMFAIQVSIAQIDSVIINMEGELEFPSQFLQLKSSISSRIDARDDRFLYSANLVFGLGIYDISDPANIQIVLEMEKELFDGLSVSTIQQIGNYLFVGLGDFQTQNPASGLAIIDITDPESPAITDTWTSEDFTNGVSHLDIYEGIAYLSVMNDGLLILDVNQKEDIKFVSSFIPDLTFPEISDGHHQGRGITKVNDILYYTFDRGGFRSIDVSDIFEPKEIDKYINFDLITKATAAYNDVLIVGNYAYLSVDYCGLEVLDISTNPWTLVDWYDPVNCEGFNWFGAAVHTNELVTACNDSLLFVSGGNSEVIAFDISNPGSLKRVGGFFELDNELAAYGLHVLGNKISVSYINNPLNIPYIGNWGGLKVLSFSKMKTTSVSNKSNEKSIHLYPNPTSSFITIENLEKGSYGFVLTTSGQMVDQFYFKNYKEAQLSLDDLPGGIYLLKLVSNKESQLFKIIKR
ncbi:MAG: T9SS type A sorting domain-containing protein [Bacteroidota bacterium]